jgi:high-affinity iron transporter
VPQTVIPYFLYSSGILFREGLEAMLVIVALVAGTRAAARDGRAHAREIYLGALLAIVASVMLAFAINRIITDDASDTLEGIFQLFAAATLFYVSSWLTSKSQSDRWMHFINAKVESAEKSRLPAFALGLTAFLAVLREGGETIVFFQALTAGATETAEKHAVIAGIVAASVALIVAFLILKRAVYRIPLGAFFKVTSVLLYAMAVVFVGQGIASLQEADRIGATFIGHVPTIPTLGIAPTVQSLGAQAALILIAAASFLIPRATPTIKAPESSRPQVHEQRTA